jgi:aminoglycoside phosphotransferase (APT) family kinase protein
VDINDALVQRLVANQFPQWSDLQITPVELDGEDNRTFRLGDTMLVRLPSGEAYASQVEKEQRWLPRLAPALPFPIPVPLAQGPPNEHFPWPWSIYRWLEGTPAALTTVDRVDLAVDVARFLTALHRVDPEGGPAPGPHNFFRGASPRVYDHETREALETLEDAVDVDACNAVWQRAMAHDWPNPPVWVHGDIATSNLLVDGGRLVAVIDFGCSCVGDPACDLVIAWTYFSGESRKAFVDALPLDEATWARGRGWALWKSLKQLAQAKREGVPGDEHRRVIEEVLADSMRATAVRRPSRIS